jgi:hypothetical protein
MPNFLENFFLRNTSICTNCSPHFCISFIIVLNFPKEKELDKPTKLYGEFFFKKNVLKIKFKGFVYK